MGDPFAFPTMAVLAFTEGHYGRMEAE